MEASATEPSLENRISSLDVSDKWKDRFLDVAHLRRATGGRGDYYRNTQVEGSRAGVRFSVMGFLFGFVYYFFKGMHRRGLVGIGLMGAYVAATSLVENQFEVSLPAFLFYAPTSFVAAVLANADFFDTRVEGLHMWPALRRLDSWAASWLVAVVGVGAAIAVSIELSDATVSQIESVLERELEELVEIDVEVVCPNDAPVREGGAFTCVATAGGESALVEVTMTSDIEFLWEVPDPGA